MDHRGYHGYSQWMRVPYNGRLLEKAKNANIKVVELFWLLHDFQRQNENREPNYGYRAAQYAKTRKASWFDLDDAEMYLLTEA